jgi:hypothetical protein
MVNIQEVGAGEKPFIVTKWAREIPCVGSAAACDYTILLGITAEASLSSGASVLVCAILRDRYRIECVYPWIFMTAGADYVRLMDDGRWR